MKRAHILWQCRKCEHRHQWDWPGEDLNERDVGCRFVLACDMCFHQQLFIVPSPVSINEFTFRVTAKEQEAENEKPEPTDISDELLERTLDTLHHLDVFAKGYFGPELGRTPMCIYELEAILKKRKAKL